MRKIVLLVLGCLLICIGAYRWGDMNIENGKSTIIAQFYKEVNDLFFPHIYLYDVSGKELIVRDAENVLLPTIVSYSTSTVCKEKIGQDEADTSATETSGIIESNGETENEEIKSSQEKTELDGTMGNNSEENDDTKGNSETAENAGTTETVLVTEETQNNASETEAANIQSMEKKVIINRNKLQDFDYLIQNFYQVDNTTTIGREQLDVNQLLEKDMRISDATGNPQILIYHTHSQEAFADSTEGASMSVIALGDYLEQLLEENYGFQVLHHKGEYDVPTRDSAYSQALPHLEQILKENPDIEVVIDLHRDGVPETTRLVTEIDGKPTAKIMFFNGLSRTTSQGDLAYLENPNIESNLAFSFQMQLTAAEYYPGLTRPIYLKGYRYNMHLCPKSLLVEIGAQNNTFEEAKNAIAPLADILAKVLKG